MSDLDQIRAWFIQLLGMLPELVVCLGGSVWFLVRWRRASSGAGWALLGFVLLLAAAFFGPGVQGMIQRWTRELAMPWHQVGWFYLVFGVTWSILRALAYGFLAVAVYTGRSTPPPLPRPPDLPPV